MKGIKKSVGIGISIMLLLCFSVTILPFDAFHSHPESRLACRDAKSLQSCNHKQHVSQRSSFCWMCAIHFDKTFTGNTFLDKVELSPALSLFTENRVTGYYIELLFSALRAPPAE